MTTATENNTPPLFSGFASRSEMLFPIQQPVDDSQCCCCCCRAAAFSFRRSEERRPLEQKQKQRQRRRRRWLSLLCFDGYKKFPLSLTSRSFKRGWDANHNYRKSAECSFAVGLAIPFFTPTTTIALLRQGTWLTRPDPWPQIEGTLYWVPEFTGGAGLLHMSSTTLCQLSSIKPFSRLGCHHLPLN